MASVKLQWSSAEVDDAVLTVPLDGDQPKGWKHSFETTVKLLGDGEWGKVRVKKGALQVSNVAPGTEDKLCHYLESVVAQANAADEARDEAAPDGDAEEPSGPDVEMTGRFRAFAEEPEGTG